MSDKATAGPAAEEMQFCQSCGMPIDEMELRGTEKDGGLSEDYCIYCYRDGAFTEDCSMEQMIAHCAEMVDEFNKDSEVKYTNEEGVAQMRQFFPQLKRWKEAAGRK